MREIKQGKILIVDDHVANVKLLEKILKMNGYENVKSTTDPREVEQLYQEFVPDVILLDIRMPYMDGFKVMEVLQEKIVPVNDYLPVMVLTAQNNPENMKKALQLGARDFLGKPFNHDEILLRLRNTLEVRLLHEQVITLNKKLEEKVRHRTKQLEESQFELIRRLGRAAEYRDNDTGSHIIRMSSFVRVLAEQLGYSSAEVALLQHASTMHDVGKISVPDTILLKPGPLTDQEWEVMKTHTTIGAELLSGSLSPLLQAAEKIALTHHEKWDGSGYPNRLKGEEIPVTGRMVAICDVFDALTSDRPYKRAWSPEEAMEEIVKESGTHFDPELVNQFVKIFPKIKDIMQEHRE